MNNFNEANVRRDSVGRFASKPGSGTAPEANYVSLADGGIPATTVADPHAMLVKEARAMQKAYQEGRTPTVGYVSAASGGIDSKVSSGHQVVDEFKRHKDNPGYATPGAGKPIPATTVPPFTNMDPAEAAKLKPPF